MVTWATPDTFAVADKPTAAQVNKITGDLQLIGGAWTAYTPVWTGTGVSLGNGSLTGAYKLIDKTVRLRIRFLAGSSTNFGSAGATWSFTLPPGVTSVAVEQSLLLKAYMGSAGNIFAGLGIISASSTTVQCFAPTSSANCTQQLIDATHPATWVSGGNIGIHGVFEAA